MGGEDHQVPARNQIKPSRLNHRTLWFSSCRNLWYRHGILIGFLFHKHKEPKRLTWTKLWTMIRPKCSANDAYLVLGNHGVSPWNTEILCLCQVAVAETVEPQEPEAPEEPEEAAEEAHVFPHFFQSVLVFPQARLPFIFLIVLFCLSKNSTKGLIQGIEGGMIIKIGTDLETRRDFGSSVIIRRKVYIVTLMVVLERSCRVRWAVLHNEMKHVFFCKLEQCSQYNTLLGTITYPLP